MIPRPGGAPVAEAVPDEPECRHSDTEATATVRWRLCRQCFRRVHRIDTDHYASLADARIYNIREVAAP